MLTGSGFDLLDSRAIRSHTMRLVLDDPFENSPHVAIILPRIPKSGCPESRFTCGERGSQVGELRTR